MFEDESPFGSKNRDTHNEFDVRENSQNDRLSSRDKKRNLIGFWLLGLCNNFAYVIMLSAAHDILKEQEHKDGNSTETTTISPKDDHYLQCNPISTGAILLADILPTLIIKLTAPFYIQYISYRLRVVVVVLFSLSSFLLVGFSVGIWMSILGVVCASICGGLGEVTYMSLSAFFDRNVISTYSSGTGGAGVFGALSYAGLTSAGLSPRNTLFVMVIIPVTMAISYFVILVKPASIYSQVLTPETENNDNTALLGDSTEGVKKRHFTLKEKLILLVPLLKYMIPLILVYFAEYFINQGLMEILYFNNTSLSISEQYRWYQVDYQLGVFISRSSVNLFEIKKLWTLPVLQFVNLGILLSQVFYRYIPNIAIVFVIILFEGLLGGAAFVNTFYRISKEIRPEFREFSLGAATIADSFGISIAGAVAIPSHNHICSLNLKVM